MSRAIIVAGWPCTGKTTLSRELAQENRYILLDKDIIFTELTEAALIESGYDKGDYTSSFYKNNLSPIIYNCLEIVAREIVSSGGSVILTAPYGRRVTNPLWREEIESFIGCPVDCVWMTASINDIYKRRKRRGAHHDIVALKSWEGESAFIDTDLRPACDHLYLNTSVLSKEESLGQAAKYCFSD